jgi:hypothetical protein
MLPDSGLVCAISAAFTVGCSIGILWWEYRRSLR